MSRIPNLMCPCCHHDKTIQIIGHAIERNHPIYRLGELSPYMYGSTETTIDVRCSCGISFTIKTTKQIDMILDEEEMNDTR